MQRLYTRGCQGRPTHRLRPCQPRASLWTLHGLLPHLTSVASQSLNIELDCFSSSRTCVEQEAQLSQRDRATTLRIFGVLGIELRSYVSYS